MAKILLMGLVFLGFGLIFPLAFAQETKPLNFYPSPKPKTSEYALPYPGLLPGSPLYPLKSLRDFLLRRMIREPERRMEFELLVSDKKLRMAEIFYAENKTDAAVAILSESIADLQRSKQYLFKIPAPKAQVSSVLKDRFEMSLAKHDQVIRGLTLIPPEKTSVMLVDLESVNQEFQTSR